jgi:hypothetical protein
MPPKKFTRTQLNVCEIHESDDTLQAAASTAERTTPTVLPEHENNNDDDLYNDLKVKQEKIAPSTTTMVISVLKNLRRIV